MRTGLVVLLATLVTALVVPPAGAATGYEVTVNRTSLRPGQVLSATVTAPISCDWVLTWNGVLRHGTGRTFSTSWTAPEVTRKTRIPLRARCFHAAGRRTTPGRTAVVGGGTSQRITVTVPAATDRSVTITVLPRRTVVTPPDDGGNGGTGGTPGLPNAGGPLLWLLFAGLGAAFLGSVLVLAGGRRRPPVDQPA